MIYAVMFSLVFLAGCSSGYTRDGVTVVTYCLLGGSYIDDTKTTLNHETAPQQCDSIQKEKHP